MTAIAAIAGLALLAVVALLVAFGVLCLARILWKVVVMVVDRPGEDHNARHSKEYQATRVVRS